jgi:hypothetical protein
MISHSLLIRTVPDNEQMIRGLPDPKYGSIDENEFQQLSSKEVVS